jgi:hypothetical protein
VRLGSGWICLRVVSLIWFSIDVVESWGSSLIIFVISSSQYIYVTIYLTRSVRRDRTLPFNFLRGGSFSSTYFAKIHFQTYLPSASLFLSDLSNIFIYLFVYFRPILTRRFTYSNSGVRFTVLHIYLLLHFWSKTLATKNIYQRFSSV